MATQRYRRPLPGRRDAGHVTGTIVDTQPLSFHNGGVAVTVTATDVWRQLVSLVMDSRGDWRRSVAETTGLPFSRVRALWRLVNGPLTLAELAHSMAVDPPAATVAVNDLERRGLVRRTPHPTNRRAKLVQLTEPGLCLARAAKSVPDQPPAALTTLSETQLARLGALLGAILSDEPE
jgi:DNA-binding MarR family transcriptional regulator